ncbi:MAG: L,D-transpeptidase family protein [Gaiellaceae bacterium]
MALCAAFAAAPAAASSRAPELKLAWLAPSPRDGKTLVVSVGAPLTVRYAAEGTAAVTARGLPLGASLETTAAGAVLTWTPTEASLGSHAIVFAARRPGTVVYTHPRTLFVQVVPGAPQGTLQPTLLSSPGLSRWAYLLRPAVARAQPSLSARVVTRLSTWTSDNTLNLVLLLASARDAQGRIWYRVRLPILPNNSTGWILWGAVSDPNAVRTYLIVDRQLLVATLYRNGSPVFHTRIGAGRPYWPTPVGDFYVRDVLTNFGDPFYGPVAFGTSARSSVLTDWPGGGVVGIHGTNQPWLLPGHVSHGCIRMRNLAVKRLLGLMPLGTPLAIR